MSIDFAGHEVGWREPDTRRHLAAPKGRARMVVVVDDEPCVLEVVCAMLENEGVYEVLCATNGEEALQLLNEIPTPDLLVIDIMMPIMDGLALLSALRRDERTARIPVIVSSAVSKYDTKPLEVARVLPKPLDYDAFLAAVDELTLLRERERHEPAEPTGR